MKYNVTVPDQIFTFKRNEIGQQLFNYLFGNREKIGPRFLPTDELIIPVGKYYGNKTPIKTCMGNYLLNYVLINENIYKIVGYVNEKIDGKMIGKLDDILSKALLNDKISTVDIIDYLDRLQFFGFSLNSMISPSLTEKVMFEIPEVKAKKKELEKKYAEGLAKGDPIIADKMEKELLALAKSKIGKDPGMDLFDSGSKASFGNNYKLMNVMKGAISDMDGGFKISTSNYAEGVPKEETHLFANAMVEGAYRKGVGTQKGGYLVKKYLAAFQTIVLDKKGSDCGTQHTFDIVLTPFLKPIMLYRYIKVGGKKVCLTDEVIDSYIGKLIHLYDPIYCCGDKICNKCAGDMYYKVGIINAGITLGKVGSTIMNKSLKKFHDNTVKLHTVESVDDLVL